MRELTATMTEQEWSIVGACLGEGKHNVVFSVITKLNQQFAAQSAPIAEQPAFPAVIDEIQGV